MRARYYNPFLQRFLSPDPAGLAGGQANLYAYVGNSPMNSIDLLGLNPSSSGGDGFGDISTATLIQEGLDSFLSAAPGAGSSQAQGSSQSDTAVLGTYQEYIDYTNYGAGSSESNPDGIDSESSNTFATPYISSFNIASSTMPLTMQEQYEWNKELEWFKEHQTHETPTPKHLLKAPAFVPMPEPEGSPETPSIGPPPTPAPGATPLP